MAQFLSIPFTKISGSMGGLVMQKNGTVRARVSVRDPKSSAQMAVRNGFTDASVAWKALTPAQKLTWSTLAAKVILYNKVCKAYNPTGRKLYMSCWQNGRLLAPADAQNADALGQTPPANAPGTRPSTPGINNFSVVVNLTAPPDPVWQITITADADLDHYALVLRATPMLSSDRKVITSKDFRVLTNVAVGGDIPTPAALEAIYAARFGTPQEGNQIAFEAFLMDGYGFVGPVDRSVAVAGASAALAAPAPADRPRLKAA